VPSLDIDRVLPHIEAALREDIGPGDVTTAAIVPPETVAEGRFVARETGVLAGVPLLPVIFARLDASVLIEPLKHDGETVSGGEIIASIRGPAHAVLSGERVALNYLQRLSGIATVAHQFAAKAERYGARILDTRKTAPGWRYLAKYAVLAGGGHNHRMGLYDQVLIKDNHLVIAEQRWPGRAVAGAVQAAREHAPPGTLVEVEAATLDQVRDALEAEADAILLDNMTRSQMRKAVKMATAYDPRPFLEASGNVTLDRVAAIAKTGVDWISVGAITHSAPALDIALDLDPLA
jgi:nicotinate-nucleotide pyrophosphorylase (carboxylating)